MALFDKILKKIFYNSCLKYRRIALKNLALYIRDFESLCLSDETVKAVGPFYLVSMPGEVKYPTQGVNV